MHFGCTKTNPEKEFSGLKYRLPPISRFDSAECLDATGGTLRLQELRLKNTAATAMCTTMVHNE